jgi:hypothetical protein
MAFDRVTTLSLESAEDLDTRFATALDELFVESPVRQQVVVDLQGESRPIDSACMALIRDAANRMYPQYERLMAVIKYSISNQTLGESPAVNQ